MDLTSYISRTSLTSKHPTRVPDGATRVLKAADLVADDVVMAAKDGLVYHVGPVRETQSSMGILWIFDRMTTTRKIIEFKEFEVYTSDILAPTQS